MKESTYITYLNAIVTNATKIMDFSKKNSLKGDEVV